MWRSCQHVCEFKHKNCWTNFDWILYQEVPLKNCVTFSVLMGLKSQKVPCYMQSTVPYHDVMNIFRVTLRNVEPHNTSHLTHLTGYQKRVNEQIVGQCYIQLHSTKVKWHGGLQYANPQHHYDVNNQQTERNIDASRLKVQKYALRSHKSLGSKSAWFLMTNSFLLRKTVTYFYFTKHGYI